MRCLIPLLLLTAACPEQTGVACPPNTSIVGQYALAFTARHDAGDECMWRDDAGNQKSLALDDAGTRQATLCVATGADAGAQLQLLIPGKGGVRKSDLLPDGGLHFVSDPVVAQGTACFCDVNVAETFDGFLKTSGPFALLPDGGLPPVSGLSAILADALTQTAVSCGVCNLPCTISYAIDGSPF